MYAFTKSVFINRPQQVVFDFMSYPSSLTKWQPIEFAEWTSTDMPGIGSPYEIIIKFLGRIIETVFEITSWDPLNRYSYRSINIPFPVESIESDITLTPKESGTQLNFDAHIGTIGLFKFAERILGRQAEKGDGNSIENLKKFLEAG